MRLLYIFHGGDLSSTDNGVQKKIFSKINALNQLGAVCDCISFSRNIKEIKFITSNIRVIPFEHKTRKFLNTVFENKNLYKALSEFLLKESDNYDAIIYRYPLASKDLFRLSRKFDKKFIFEHNTKETDEIEIQQKTFRKSLRFSIKPGYFIYLFEGGFLPLLLEKYYGPKIFKYAKSGIAVTREIASYEEQRQLGYKNYVVTNGIDVEKCSLRVPINYNQKVIKCFMLLGNGAPWHGVDRLINGLINYKGSIDIKIDIIGAYNEQDKVRAEELGLGDKINFIENIPYNLLNDKLNEYHVGIGTLSAYRKKLNEATPLKVREYLARGFPCVISYIDTDLVDNLDFSPFFLMLQPNDSPVNFELVIQFVKEMYSDDQHYKKIRALAYKHLDIKVKMEKLLDIARMRSI